MSFINEIYKYWGALPDGIKVISHTAFGGAISPIFIGYSGRRSRLKEDLKSLSIVQNFCVYILNKALQYKKLINGLNIEYNDQYETYLKLFEDDNDKKFEIEYKLVSLPTINTPVNLLEKAVCEKLSIGVEAVSAYLSIFESLNQFNSEVAVRNNLCTEFHNFNQDNLERQKQLCAKYFGLDYNDNLDERFKNNLINLTNQIDNLIHFSIFLEKLVVQIENNLRLWNLLYFLSGQKLIASELDDENYKNLIPDPENYREWHSGFVRRPSFFSKLDFFRKK